VKPEKWPENFRVRAGQVHLDPTVQLLKLHACSDLREARYQNLGFMRWGIKFWALALFDF